MALLLFGRYYPRLLPRAITFPHVIKPYFLTKTVCNISFLLQMDEDPIHGFAQTFVLMATAQSITINRMINLLKD